MFNGVSAELMTQSLQPQGRLIKRVMSIQPAFHETDMMGVIHNAVYFLWFERGRLQIMLELLPIEEAMSLGVAMPVVENVCRYHRPVRFGCPLRLYTTHRILPTYEGKLVFNHYLIHEKQKSAMASGQSVATLINAQNHRLIKDWPGDVWQRYQALT